MKKFPVAFQSYTIRHELAKDYVGALERAAEIGYKRIEVGMPSEGMRVSEQKGLLNRLGLKVVGVHADFSLLELDANSVVDYLEEVDSGKFVTTGCRFSSKQEAIAIAKKLNEIGEKLRKRDCTLLYHNHNWEFEQFDGEYAMDILLRETDSDLVKTEPDVYWIQRGGEEPASYLKRLKNRAPLLHIKDMEPGDSCFFTEIGEGIIDFNAIATVSEEIGVQCMVVEQDETRGDPFTSLKLSYDNLTKLGFME